MKKSHFILLVVIFCVIISLVAQLFPVAVIAIGTCSLPFLFIWCIVTDNNRLKDKKITKKTN